MTNYSVGTELFIEQGGSGWAKITGYNCVVLSREEAEEFANQGGFIEGLGLDGDIFVEVPSLIYADDEGEDSDLDDDDREVEYDGFSVWGISLNSNRLPIAKVEVR